MGVAQKQPPPGLLGAFSILFGEGLWGHLSGRAWENPQCFLMPWRRSKVRLGGEGRQAWDASLTLGPHGSSRTRMLQDLCGDSAPLPFAPGPAP